MSNPDSEFIETKQLDFTEFVKPRESGFGVIIDEATDYDHWAAAVQGYGDAWKRLGEGQERTQFALGDLYIFGERKFGAKFTQAMDASIIDEKLLTRVLWVCNTIPPDERHAALSFTHHEAVTSVKDSLQREELLKTAEAEKLSVKQLTKLRKEKFPTKRDKKPSKTSAAALKIDLTDENEVLQGGHMIIAFLEKAEADMPFRKWPKDRLGKWNPILSTLVKIARRSIIKTH